MTTEQSGQMQAYLKEIGDQVNALSNVSTEMAQFRSNFNERMITFQNEYLQGNKIIQESISALGDISHKLNSNEEKANIINELNKVSDNLNKYNKMAEDLSSFAFLSDKDGIESISFSLKLREGSTIADAQRELENVFPVTKFRRYEKKGKNTDVYSIQVDFSRPLPSNVVFNYIQKGARCFYQA